MKVNDNGTWRDTKPFVNVGSEWKPVSTGWVNVGGTWRKFYTSEYLYTISGLIANFNLFDVIGTPEEDEITVVIEPTSIIYSNSVNSPAFNIGNAYAGKKVNIINKGKIYGAGAAVSSGQGTAGGTALYVRTENPVTVTNEGTIAGGGGSGGKGGTGGPGYYTQQVPTYQREPASGEYYNPDSHVWTDISGGKTSIRWDGGFPVNQQEGIGTSVTLSDGWTYHRGSRRGGQGFPGGSVTFYGVFRDRTINVPTTAYTNGGAGGTGGQGQGYNQSNTQGTGGAPGGINAGAGGHGGAGGTYGQSGATGNIGAAGNRGAGTSGSSGGRGGYSIDGNSKVTLATVGTLLGPRAN